MSISFQKIPGSSPMMAMPRIKPVMACEGKACGASLHGDAGESEPALRNSAFKAGWQHVANKDLCHDCKADAAAAPPDTAAAGAIAPQVKSPARPPMPGTKPPKVAASAPSKVFAAVKHPQTGKFMKAA